MLDTFFANFDALPVWVNALTGVITAATAITMLTPTKTDDRVVNIVLKILNFLAGNIFRNQNSDAGR